jgi:hypothetical protein
LSEEGWKRDNTPYLVFACKKCHQYSYVKITQKTKKCLRCGRMHQVNSIISEGKIVNGMTAALEMVKRKQAELAEYPEFQVEQSFSIITKFSEPSYKDINKRKRKSIFSLENEEENYDIRFKEMLTELSKMYPTFPKYLIDSMADKYAIPGKFIPSLIRKLIKQGGLKHSNKNNLYFLSN